MYVYMYIYMYVCMYVCMYICIYMYIFIYLIIYLCRVQKNSRLHDSEPGEDLVFYVVFEEGLVICTNNLVS